MKTALLETARALARARHEVRRITLAPDQTPATIAQAYDIQDTVGRLLAPGGAAIRGWKVGAPDAKSLPKPLRSTTCCRGRRELRHRVSI